MNGCTGSGDSANNNCTLQCEIVNNRSHITSYTCSASEANAGDLVRVDVDAYSFDTHDHNNENNNSTALRLVV